MAELATSCTRCTDNGTWCFQSPTANDYSKEVHSKTFVQCEPKCICEVERKYGPSPADALDRMYPITVTAEDAAAAAGTHISAIPRDLHRIILGHTKARERHDADDIEWAEQFAEHCLYSDGTPHEANLYATYPLRDKYPNSSISVRYISVHVTVHSGQIYITLVNMMHSTTANYINYEAVTFTRFGIVDVFPFSESRRGCANYLGTLKCGTIFRRVSGLLGTYPNELYQIELWGKRKNCLSYLPANTMCVDSLGTVYTTKHCALRLCKM